MVTFAIYSNNNGNMVVGEIPEFFQFPKRDISTARCKCTIYIIASRRMPGHHLLFISTEAGVWMHSRLEKPIIREKRAETSLAAFIKLGFPIARMNNWETQERVFEEERLIFNLSLKRGSLRKYKDYSWAFENDEKRTFLVWRPISKAIFQKLKPASKNPGAGSRKWIFPETMRFNSENW